jgi:hypothetical protein
MTIREIRKAILRAGPLYLPVAQLRGLRADVLGSLFGSGPVMPILAAAPHSGIGFIEAHGLASIISVPFWQATPDRSWHLTGAAVHTLIGHG